MTEWYHIGTSVQHAATQTLSDFVAPLVPVATQTVQDYCAAQTVAQTLAQTVAQSAQAAAVGEAGAGVTATGLSATVAGVGFPIAMTALAGVVGLSVGALLMRWWKKTIAPPPAFETAAPAAVTAPCPLVLEPVAPTAVGVNSPALEQRPLLRLHGERLPQLPGPAFVLPLPEPKPMPAVPPPPPQPSPAATAAGATAAATRAATAAPVPLKAVTTPSAAPIASPIAMQGIRCEACAVAGLAVTAVLAVGALSLQLWKRSGSSASLRPTLSAGSGTPTRRPRPQAWTTEVPCSAHSHRLGDVASLPVGGPRAAFFATPAAATSAPMNHPAELLSLTAGRQTVASPTWHGLAQPMPPSPTPAALGGTPLGARLGAEAPWPRNHRRLKPDSSSVDVGFEIMRAMARLPHRHASCRADVHIVGGIVRPPPPSSSSVFRILPKH